MFLLGPSKCAATRKRHKGSTSGPRPAMNRHRASEGNLGIAKGCRSNLAAAEGLKPLSPFALTVRAATDCVKAFRKHLPGPKCLAGPLRYPRATDLC